MTDAINPAHYTAGRRFEVIEVLEDWAQFAPNVKQGIALAQALKYLGRMYSKGDPAENLQKAQWFLDRLGQHLVDDFQGKPADLDLGDDLPWDPTDDPYWHPDTALFGLKNEGALKNLGLIGGISDGDLSDEDWAAFYDSGFTVDVGEASKKSNDVKL